MIFNYRPGHPRQHKLSKGDGERLRDLASGGGRVTRRTELVYQRPASKPVVKEIITFKSIS